MPAAPPVSFLVSRFPNPSETFIQAQAEGLMERGCAVEIVALAPGDAVVLGALRLKWENKLTVRYVPLPKTLGARLAAAPRPSSTNARCRPSSTMAASARTRHR
jgi:hypothetical protein